MPPLLISAETLGAAADLLEYFKSHTRRAYRHLGRQRRSLTLDVYQALRTRGPLSESVLLRDVFQRNIPAEAIRKALEELEETGLAAWHRDEQTGGRPATVWRAL